jgi:hypothetical protein
MTTDWPAAGALVLTLTSVGPIQTVFAIELEAAGTVVDSNGAAVIIPLGEDTTPALAGLRFVWEFAPLNFAISFVDICCVNCCNNVNINCWKGVPAACVDA